MILDFIGASYWEKNMASIKQAGRWVLIGLLGGSKLKEVDLSEIMAKYVELKGTLLTPRSNAYKARLTNEFVQKTMPFIERKEITSIIDTLFPLIEVQNAHLYMEGNHNIGKIVLKVGSEDEDMYTM